MPWPGPHLMSLMSMSEVPGPKEMQSSPVPMVVLRMLTCREWLTWMPSVLGLLDGAMIRTPWTVTPLQSKMDMWNSLLSSSVSCFTLTPLDWLMSSVCKHKYVCVRLGILYIYML